MPDEQHEKPDDTASEPAWTRLKRRLSNVAFDTIWGNVVTYVAVYLLGLLTAIFGQEALRSGFVYQDAFVNAERRSMPAPAADYLEPFLAEIRLHANTDGIAFTTPFGASLAGAYCKAFRPGRTDALGALAKFEIQFPGCLAVTRASTEGETRLTIQPGPDMSAPVAFYRPEDGARGRIGFCGCDEAARTEFLMRNARLHGVSAETQ